MTHKSKRAALVAAIMVATAPMTARAAESAQLAGFQAFLFNSGTGGFSPDVIKNRIALGNVVASGHQSVSTFVVVDIDSGDAPLPDTARLRRHHAARDADGQRQGCHQDHHPRFHCYA